MNIPARRVSSMVGIGACSLGTTLLISALLPIGVSPASAQGAQPTSRPAPARGKTLFARDCAFCHGRDAAGGESGPDLTRSRLVARDVRGDKIDRKSTRLNSSHLGISY